MSGQLYDNIPTYPANWEQYIAYKQHCCVLSFPW